MVTDITSPEECAERIFELSGHRFTPDVAVELWDKILEHKWVMSERLGRDVGLKVACRDFFESTDSAQIDLLKKDISSVLIIDDEPDMCWALKTLLSEKGYTFRIAPTGKDALRMMADKRFTIALLDAKLPDTDGLQLAAEIKSIDPSVSIIIISGYYYENDVKIQEAIQKGLVFGFLAKPFFHEDLFKMLDTAGPCGG
jgi:CheY-like chemotaxis protein